MKRFLIMVLSVFVVGCVVASENEGPPEKQDVGIDEFRRIVTEQKPRIGLKKFKTSNFKFLEISLGESEDSVKKKYELYPYLDHTDNKRRARKLVVYAGDNKYGFECPIFSGWENPLLKNTYSFVPNDKNFEDGVVAFELGYVVAIAGFTKGDRDTEEAIKKIIKEKYSAKEYRIRKSNHLFEEDTFGFVENIPVLVDVNFDVLARVVSVYYFAPSIAEYAEEIRSEAEQDKETDRFKDAF